MFKNALISILATALLFSTEAYAGFDMITFVAMAGGIFICVCVVNVWWDRQVDRVRRYKRLKREIQKNISTPPTKAIS